MNKTNLILYTSLICISALAGYVLGVEVEREQAEERLRDFWGHYYNVDERGCYNCVKERK